MIKRKGRLDALEWVRPWLPAILWLLLIFLLSGLPIPGDKIKLIRRFDKLAHFIEFGVLGLLLVRGAYRGGMRRVRTYWLCLLAALAYAVADEVHQMLVPYRTADLADIVADMLGSLVFSWGYLRWKGQSLIPRKDGKSGPPRDKLSRDKDFKTRGTLEKIT